MSRSTKFAIIGGDDGSSSKGGDGPEDPMIEARVAALEERLDRVDKKIDRIDAALGRLEPAIRDIASELKELRKASGDAALKAAVLEGHVRSLPTSLQVFGVMLTTWAAGAAIVAALLRLTGR